MAEGVVPEDREEDGVTEEEEDSVYIGNIITGTQYAVFYIEVTLIILNTKVCTTQYKQTRRYQGPGPRARYSSTCTSRILQRRREAPVPNLPISENLQIDDFF
jgi:hypothetical protein